MKPVEDKSWVGEILLGRKPAKVKAFRETKEIRVEIIELYRKIAFLNCSISSKEKREKAVELLWKNGDMIAKLRKTIEICYANNGEKPVRLILAENSKWRIDIIPSESMRTILIKVPVIEDDGW